MWTKIIIVAFLAVIVYNLGSGRTTTYNQIVDAVREGLGVTARDLPTDYFAMPESIRAFYQDYTCADMTGTARGLASYDIFCVFSLTPARPEGAEQLGWERNKAAGKGAR